MTRTPTAYLTGTWRQPTIRLVFASNARDGRGKFLIDWVKKLPGRTWNPAEKAWDVTGTGPAPMRELAARGFTIDLNHLADDPSLAGVESLDDLVAPLLKRSKTRPHVVLVRPRLAGFEMARGLLGAGARWDRATGRFEMPLTDVLDSRGRRRAGVHCSDAVVEAARQAREPGDLIEGVSSLALASSVDDAAEAGRSAISLVGDVPYWFALALYPYQRAGAIAAAGGHRLLGDEPGLGKTRQALAAHAITGVSRLLIVSPPVALTQWQRETSASKVASRPATPGVPRTESEVVVITSKRKEPAFPDVGAVVVSDSLLASRPALLERIRAWAPDGLIVDEVHRHKTWDSSRAKAVRDVAEGIDGVRIAISGTPMLANPVELASPLAITGQLGPVFGGYDTFATTYARQNHFKAWVARKKMLPQLRRMFDDRVWVRRRKNDVLDLPAKTRHDLITDVDLSGFRQAHKDVKAKVAEWVEDYLDEHGKLPGQNAITEYARDSIGLTSMLRRAAGLAKVAPATDYIVDWIAQTGTGVDEQGRTTFNRPLVVWTHHRAVSEAMAAAVPEAVGGARVIIGGTDNDTRTRIVDDFQAGLVPVIVASITAAGTGITLTCSSDALFVETDWTPALVQQAEDRIHRIGSNRPVTITTMVAPGTLDERVQKVLADKGLLLEDLMGEGQDVSVVDFEDDESVAPAQIIAEIAHEVVAKMKRQRPTTARAA